MAKELHTLELAIGSDSLGMEDRAQVAIKLSVATASAAAGVAVSTAISGLQLPAKYGVWVEPNQDAVSFVTAKTQTGFTVTLNPRLAANALAAGTIDILIVA